MLLTSEPSPLLQEIFHTENKDITWFEVGIKGLTLFNYFKYFLFKMVLK